MGVRTQLSMYVPEPVSALLEPVRRILDPVQSSLIPAHVTLCREDELASLDHDKLACRLTDIPMQPVTLHFGKPEPFSQHGILLPCISGHDEFIALREHILGSRSIRRPPPHITLAHPRNPKSDGNRLENANVLGEGVPVTFAHINLIQQVSNDPWRVLSTYSIPGTIKCRAEPP